MTQGDTIIKTNESTDRVLVSAAIMKLITTSLIVGAHLLSARSDQHERVEQRYSARTSFLHPLRNGYQGPPFN
ncbi:MAG: hypothetical protein J07HQW1_01667 [Haloquadratum walsbyi J07HQW1]|uniref:Uncharacterized protein n=1 Tax=Haloquadratum walsbyi J07HQW1 TaxID=1238424 RepID=U1N5D3_9EURY|nr:MAG: hypothetical protein J07HQW1_01667 [Haloquadratum walsbyi J07HQW1]